MGASIQHINLRGTPCPLNFVRSSLAIESLSPNEILHIDLDKGEPEELVIPGLRNAGHSVEVLIQESEWLRLKVVVSGAK